MAFLFVHVSMNATFVDSLVSYFVLRELDRETNKK